MIDSFFVWEQERETKIKKNENLTFESATSPNQKKKVRLGNICQIENVSLKICVKLKTSLKKIRKKQSGFVCTFKKKT